MALESAEARQRQAPASELMVHLGYLLNKAALGYKARADAAVDPLGLYGKLMGVLVVVQGQGPLTQQRLGQLVGVDRSTMVQLIDSLEAKALVERQSVATDRRSHAVAITAKGRKVLEQAIDKVGHEEKAYLSPLNQAEQKALRSLLGRLIVAHHPQEEGA